MFSGDDADILQRRRFTRRALILGGAKLGTLGLVASQLYRLQVLQGARYVPLAEENRLNIQVLAPRRGRILDRNGIVLAENEDSYRAVLVPALTRDVRATVALFARIVPLGIDQQTRIVARARRQSPNVPVVLAAKLAFEDIARINLFAPQLPGVRTEVDSRRRYRHGGTMAHVVGYVGSVERRALDDAPVLRLPGFRVGKSGVELGMDDSLRGRAGHVKQEVDALGRIVRQLEKHEPRRGADTMLTIDTTLQARVLDRMSQEKSAALVALDVTTGEVLVMASVPNFDNAIFTDPDVSRELRRLQTTQHNPMVNRAIRGAYPPGSTFKMVVALAALERGVVKPRERINCEGSYTLADHVYRCWNRNGHGASDLHKALRESCDVYFYELARRTGIKAIAAMARRLGLGQTFDCGIALQKAGVVPDPDWKRLRLGRAWLDGDTILTGVGQGYVLSTPLQLAVMTARIATGLAVEPRLVRAQGPAPSKAPVFAPVGLQTEWLDAVRRGMFGVVNETGGTGYRARIGDGPARLAGKTGTSQVSRQSTQRAAHELAWEQRDHALFVAFAPTSQPRYAIATVIEHGGSGGAVAAPLVREVMEELLAAEPESRSPPFAPDEPSRGANEARQG
ncbi:MAG: penicillin-binding protein 2 [Hyphomicrobiaceae bacterium]